jgi:hypothetical protein
MSMGSPLCSVRRCRQCVAYSDDGYSLSADPGHNPTGRVRARHKDAAEDGGGSLFKLNNTTEEDYRTCC